MMDEVLKVLESRRSCIKFKYEMITVDELNSYDEYAKTLLK